MNTTSHFQITPLLNVSRKGGALFEFTPGTTCVRGPVDFVIEATDAYLTLETAWTAGNKMGHDSVGRTYPMNWRSVSVGDIIEVIPHDGGDPIYYAVDRFGFKWVSPSDFECVPTWWLEQAVETDDDLSLPYRNI